MLIENGYNFVAFPSGSGDGCYSTWGGQSVGGEVRGTA
ncbi:DUF4241 domain-containing protein [Kitasatospora sp. NPDC091276]